MNMNTDLNSEQNLHYSEDYFKWQSEIGTFGGMANKFKFEEFIKPTDYVIDFGAGGGYLIEQIQCKKKCGVEINASARATAEKRGVPMVATLDQLENGSVDVAISNSALEHTDAPLDILKQIYRILKPGGKAVFVVPCEAITYLYEENDINFHLYTWSPMNFGNLFVRAGFKVLKSEPLRHKWPRQHYQKIQKLFGWGIFHLVCKLYSYFTGRIYQVRCVAIKQ